jgi:hypothetical protein
LNKLSPRVITRKRAGKFEGFCFAAIQILIDRATNDTVAAGMIVSPVSGSDRSRKASLKRGRVFSVQESQVEVLRNVCSLSLPADLVVLSNWNEKAVNALSETGFDVFLLNAPTGIGAKLSQNELLSMLVPTRAPEPNST